MLFKTYLNLLDFSCSFCFQKNPPWQVWFGANSCHVEPGPHEQATKHCDHQGQHREVSQLVLKHLSQDEFPTAAAADLHVWLLSTVHYQLCWTVHYQKIKSRDREEQEGWSNCSSRLPSHLTLGSSMALPSPQVSMALLAKRCISVFKSVDLLRSQ